MSFNVITGMPRSGSTLLCNILNQNPEFYASSTSLIGAMVESISNIVSNTPEAKSDLIKDSNYEQRLKTSIVAFVEKWYPENKVIFDKGRGWSNLGPLFHNIFPTGKMIVTVRDLREIAASIEKQHLKNPVFETHTTGRSLWTRVDEMYSSNGIVGRPLAGVEDILHRNLEDTIFVDYKTLVEDPELILRRLYKELELEPFKHDFDNVKNVATDTDELYLNKFPHEGSGKVEPPKEDEWKKYISPELANAIYERFPFYNKRLKYA